MKLKLLILFILKKYNNSLSIITEWNCFLSTIPQSSNFIYNYYTYNGNKTKYILYKVLNTHYKSQSSLAQLISVDNLNDTCYVGFTEEQFTNYKNMLNLLKENS